MGRPRRRLTWVNYSQTALVVGVSGHALNIDLLADYKALPDTAVVGSTVLRTHLKLWPATAVAAGDRIKLGVQVGGQNEVQPSFVLGAAAFDNPSDFPYLDWMLSDQWEARPNYNEAGSTNGLAIDLKSKRKIGDLGKTLMASIVAANVGASLSVDVFARILLALP